MAKHVAKHHKKAVRRGHATPQAHRRRSTPARPKEPAAGKEPTATAAAGEEQQSPLFRSEFIEELDFEAEPQFVDVVEIDNWPL